MTRLLLPLDQSMEENTANTGLSKRHPQPHQQEAFQALDRTFDLKPGQVGHGGLLVLPTGAGKTYTAVTWLCQNVLPKKIKVLWLAHSFFLLDQAHKTFEEEAHPKPKIRKVSSELSHDRAFNVETTDEVVIMTTQTAISQLYKQRSDGRNQPFKTKFHQFIEEARKSGLFVVLDEAHHAPAYGCRNLLISQDKARPGLRTMLPGLNLLGLTATPAYHNELCQGWLGKIFEKGILYQTSQSKLMLAGILARPNFIEKPTGRQFEVNESLYDQLVRQHKDLPETLVEKLATDQQRNDGIVAEYVANKERYGKTIIFADRWFQCVYLKEKLLAMGVRADAVYSHIDADPGSAQARNQRNSTENNAIMEKFRHGKDKQGRDELEVLINVRMLTEGTDVPSVRTVFVTRQTTSSILLTQMIGRALRGPKAGGGKEANIVLFTDKWKGLLAGEVWAMPAGEANPDKPVVQGAYPLDYISISLVERLSRQMMMGEIDPLPSIHYLPVGWYETQVEISPSDEAESETQTFHEFVMVYEHTRPKFETFLKALEGLDMPSLDKWAKEYLPEAWLQEQAQGWLARFFDPAEDAMGAPLDQYLLRIARHYAQKKVMPAYHPFEEREHHDLDKLAEQLIELNMYQQTELLQVAFSKPGNLWKVFYKTFDSFQLAATTAALWLHKRRSIPGSTVHPPVPPEVPVTSGPNPTHEQVEQVKRRDGYKCLACGATGQGVRLQMDHITPYSWGGKTEVDNLQSLCQHCNRLKSINEINFRIHVSLISGPKTWENIPPRNKEDLNWSLTRLINFFYHTSAVCQIERHVRKNGKYYQTWRIQLYEGNNPQWLIAHKADLLKYIHESLDCSHVTDIVVTSNA